MLYKNKNMPLNEKKKREKSSICQTRISATQQAKVISLFMHSI